MVDCELEKSSLYLLANLLPTGQQNATKLRIHIADSRLQSRRVTGQQPVTRTSDKSSVSTDNDGNSYDTCHLLYRLFNTFPLVSHISLHFLIFSSVHYKD